MSAQLSKNDELVLGPWVGLLAGTLLGGLVATAAAPQAGVDINWAASWLPWMLSGVFGLLYGACQLRIPVKGLITVGIFYGVFLWVLTNIVGWALFPTTLKELRTWPGIGMFVLFSGGLGLISVLYTLAGGGKSVEEARH